MKKSNVEMLAGPGSNAAEQDDAADRSRATSGSVAAGSLLRMIAIHWRLIAIVAVSCAVIAWAIAAMQPRRYRASVVAAVAPIAESLSAGEVLRGVEVLERRTVVATIAALAETSSVRDLAAPGGGDARIRASVLPNTNLFRITVETADAARAAAIANRVPALLSAQTRAMFKYYIVTTVSPATQPAAPFLPRTGRAVATGVLLGLFLGVVAAYIAERRYAARLGRAR